MLPMLDVRIFFLVSFLLSGISSSSLLAYSSITLIFTFLLSLSALL